MYILKDETEQIVAVSDTLSYQKNGNPLINNETMAIAKILVYKIEENDVLPSGWKYENGMYVKDIEDQISDGEALEIITGSVV